MIDWIFAVDLQILLWVNLVTFLPYAYDKHQAVYDGGRIPEAILILFAFCGGAFGALCAMILCRHKTQVSYFLACIPMFLAIQLAVEILYRMDIINF